MLGRAGVAWSGVYLGFWLLEEEEEEEAAPFGQRRRDAVLGVQLSVLPQDMFCVPSLRPAVLNKEHKSFGILEFVLPL